jgi:predicted nucleic acid-binding protein
MVVLVSDTSVLIDLERGNLPEAAFACGLTMIVPGPVLYQRELADTMAPTCAPWDWAWSPSPRQNSSWLRTSARHDLPCPPNDCFALSCATRADHTLVTADKALRSEA